MTTRRTFQKQVGAALIGALAATNASSAADRSPARPRVIDPDQGLGSEGWSIAVIPDTQNYTKYAKNQKNFDLITARIAELAPKWNIQAVLHEGDLVEQNAIAEGGGKGHGDQNAASQWAAAQRSMSSLYGKVPTLFATGNHDYGQRNAETRETQFNNYFGLTDNPLTCDGRGGGIWREGCANSFGATTLENALYTFKAPDQRDVLVLALEWSPRNEVVQWAKEALNKPEYKDHLGILLVHAYLLDNGNRDSRRDRGGNPHHYPTGKDGNANDGEDLWQKLVKDSPNLSMVLNGHITGRHVGYRCDQKSNQKKCHQMLFNAQALGGGSREKGNGGDGWIRILTFEPDLKTVSVRTFSPLKEQLGENCWNTAQGHDFTIAL